MVGGAASSIRAPNRDLLDRVLMPKDSREFQDALARSSRTYSQLRASVRSAYLRALAASALAAVGLSLAFSPAGILYGLCVAIAAPIIIASRVASDPKLLREREERAVLRESPSVIGTIVMSMHLQPSLEPALTLASQQEGVMASRMRACCWDVLMKKQRSMEEALGRFAASLSEMNDDLRQSLHLIVAATYESSREGVVRSLERANALALQGIREAAERYSSSLQTPTMLLFSIGVLVPVLLFSMLPLQAFGSIGAASELAPMYGPSTWQLAFLMLVLLPGFSLYYSKTVIERNPVRGGPGSASFNARDLAFATAASIPGVALSFLTDLVSTMPQIALSIAIVPPCVVIVALTRKAHAQQRRDANDLADLISSLYQLGNRLSGGATLEKALEDLSAVRRGGCFSSFATKALARTRLARIDIAGALRDDDELRSRFPQFQSALLTVCESSRRESRAAGSIAISLASNLDDLRKCHRKAEEGLRGTIEMMRSTSAFFAPTIFAVTIGLFSIAEEFQPSAMTETSALTLIAGLYLVELVFFVSYYSAFLSGENRWNEAVHHFASRTPVALIIFSAVSVLAHEGLTRLL